MKTILKLQYFIILILLFSCRDFAKADLPIPKSVVPSSDENGLEYEMDFPDTVYVNKIYNGMIHYKSIYDSVTTSFDDKKNYRYVMLYLKISKKSITDSEKIKKSGKIFGASNNRKIPIYNIKFNEAGTYFMYGILNDFLLIDEGKKNNQGEEMAREIEKEWKISKKVYVLNHP